MRHKNRKRLLVEPKVQGALVARALVYWACCFISVAILRGILWNVSRALSIEADGGLISYLPELLASVFFVPIIVYDILRLSNRFVGPTFRLRRCLRRLADGESVEPIHFRKGDMWQEFAEEFNAVLARVQRLSAQASTGDEPGEVDDQLAVQPGAK